MTYDHTWTHPICRKCYAKQEPGRKPTRVVDNGVETCCFCGSKTRLGIYYRKDPDKVHR